MPFECRFAAAGEARGDSRGEGQEASPPGAEQPRKRGAEVVASPSPVNRARGEVIWKYPEYGLVARELTSTAVDTITQ